MLSRESVISILRDKVELFRGFNEEKISLIVDGSELITVEENEAIIEEEEKGRFLGVILSGSLKIVRVENDGSRKIIGNLKEYEIFGEISLMTNEKTVANVVGDTHSEILLIPQTLFAKALITEPSAVAYISKLMLRRITEVSKSSSEEINSGRGNITLHSEKRKQILVINCGSSSLKYAYYDTYRPDEPFRGMVEKIGENQTIHKFSYGLSEEKNIIDAKNHREAFQDVIRVLTSDKYRIIKNPDEIDIVGHRVVHGGEKYNAPTVITEEVENEIEKASVSVS
ncbi:MAG: cyclic nucleotide-binding domain-containing protein, partial [Deltaproteobacteria bacterium]|nr:cyclic nucleotide-binding domain-containing protein [Deltaproteobacteria bacterium]